jgi:hypothetical protein
MSDVAAKDSKAKILPSFQQILAKRQTLESKVIAPEEKTKKVQISQLITLSWRQA